MINALGGRKMIAATATVGVGIGIAIYHGDVPDNLLTLLEFVFGSFAAANVANTVTGAFSSNAEVKPRTALESKPIEAPSEPAPIQEEQPKPPEGLPVEAAIQAFGELQSALQQVVDGQAKQNKQMLEQLDLIVKSSQMTQNALSMIIERISK